VSGHLCIKCSCDLVGRCGDLVRVASWRRQGLGRVGNMFAAGGGPRARRRSSGVGCPCPRLGSGEARSSPSNGLIPDLIAPIRPLQLYADGGYQLRIRSLEGTTNYGPRQYSLTTGISFFAECMKHSTKARKHSTTLGKESLADCTSAMASLPSTFYCRVSLGTQQRKLDVMAAGNGDSVFAECPPD
jgi:hypothetical protein